MASSEYRLGWTALAGLALFNAGLSVLPAAGQPTQQQQSAIRSNCRSDYISKCSSVKPGGLEALQCLQRNVAKLSPACQSAVNAVSPPAAPPQQATAAPAAAPPATEPPPAQPPAARPATPTAQSTRTMPAPVSSGSTSAAPIHPTHATATAAPAATPARPTAQQQAAIRQSCQSDFMSRCRGVQPGGADALRCLQKNSAQLSPNCQRAVAALGGGAAPATATAATADAPALASAPTPEQQNAIRFTCRRDFVINCRGVTPGSPEALACLQRNAARLTPDCKTSLAALTGDTQTQASDATPAAPAARREPIGPLRRAIRERMMNR